MHVPARDVHFVRLAPPDSIRYSRRVLRRPRGLILLLAVVVFPACSARRGPVDEANPPSWLSEMPVTALEVVEYRAVEAEGEHALFMRVSRFPDRVSYAPVEEPPEIMIRLDGPAVGEDTTEERIIIPDAMIPAVRVGRKAGVVTVMIELAAPEVPRFVVDEAADWIIVRVKPTSN